MLGLGSPEGMLVERTKYIQMIPLIHKVSELMG